MEKNCEKKHYARRALLIIIGAALIFDTVFVYMRGSWNLGVIMPLIIGLPLLTVGLFYGRIKAAVKRNRAAKIISRIVQGCYLLFILLFGLTTALILTNSREPEEPADVLIVLGCGIRGESPTLTLSYRLDRAVEYLNANPETVAVLSGGQSFDEVCSEASVMKRYLTARGIDESRLFTEEYSESTSENFLYSKELIDREFGEGRSIAFITTRFHVFRSERVAKKLGIEADGIPAKGVWYITPNDYLRECAAITAYFLVGRI